MKEEITKNNITEVAGTLKRYVKIDNDFKNISKTNLKNFNFLWGLDDGFVQKKLIIVNSGSWADVENVPEKAILYKECGLYFYCYFVDNDTKKEYLSLQEVDDEIGKGNYYLIGTQRHAISSWKYNEDLDVLVGSKYYVKVDDNDHFSYRCDSKLLIFRDKSQLRINEFRDYFTIKYGFEGILTNMPKCDVYQNEIN